MVNKSKIKIHLLRALIITALILPAVFPQGARALTQEISADANAVVRGATSGSISQRQRTVRQMSRDVGMLQSGLLPTALVHTIDTSNAAWNPSSPDPSGIDYWPVTGNLLISDSEVEEMPIYAGKNVYESTTSGTLVGTCTTTSFSSEPSGLATNPDNNHIFFSDDDGINDKIIEINVGADGTYCTADDVATLTNAATAYGATDTEDVAYGANTLFIADGDNAELFVIPLGPNGLLGGGDDGSMTHFDTAVLGFHDLEGIDYNSDSGTLFIVSTQGTENYLGEITTSGTLVNKYDLSFMGTIGNLRSDVSYAPSSQNLALKNIYIVSRGVDNSVNPNENDGKIWEINISGPGAVPTVASVVRANADPTSLASVNYTVTFSELVSGVDTTDFELNTDGVSGAAVSGVSGSGTTYNVTVNTGSGNGTIRLDVLDDNSIIDSVGSSLNGGFTTGEVYTVIKSAEVEVNIAGNNVGNYDIPLQGSERTSFPGVDDGPVQVLNSNSASTLAAMRVIWKEPGFRASYSEMMGLPVEQLSSEYWFPWYNNVDTTSMDQGFRIANVDTMPHTVKVFVGATQIGININLAAGGSTRVGYAVNNGPIRILCTDCTGSQKIIAALRVIWKEPGVRFSYSEMMGLPVEQLSSEYWFPWYNNATASMDQGFRIANVSTTEINTVEVWVGNSKLDTITLSEGGSVRVGYNVDNGPARIVCTTCTNTGSDKIIAALRVIWQEPGFRASYSEMMGLPTEQLSTEYWFPWYNNLDTTSMDQGFRIANVDTTTHTVKVFVGAMQVGTNITLAGGGSTRVGYAVNNGPIRIFCTTCIPGNNDDRIIAALRVIWQEPGYRSSYSEMMGLPKEALSTEYWFPWYNFAAPNSMDQGFRIAVP